MNTPHVPLGAGVEFDLIRRFLADGAAALPDAVRVGPGDDCTVLRGEGLCISVDLSLEGVHFERDWIEPEEVGYRAAAGALSDLAAMAATPIGILVALAVTREDAAAIAPRIMQGVRAAADGVRAVLLGGDTTRSTGPIAVDAVVVGNALRPVLRSGARPGDSLWVTGELGAAATAVQAWREGHTPESAARLAFALPTPRIAEAAWLAGRGAVDALIDLSDGLASDAGHIAAASGVRIILDAASIPIHPVVRATANNHDALRLAIAGGEDYELCFAAPPGAAEHVRELFTETFGIPLTCVGSVHDGAGVLIRDFEGGVHDLHHKGFDHFSDDE